MSTIRTWARLAIGLASICDAILLTDPCAATSVTHPSTVTTRYGGLKGQTTDGVTAFKGIPYAAPPVGDLRWRRPQPPVAWPGVRDAASYGNACIQNPDLSSAVNPGDPGPLREDCLYLNVWTPGADPSAKRPVMVWIHGGAFVLGAGGFTLSDGAPLAKKDAVVVNFNYRLGQLGFFAHPALEKEAPGGTANFGLLDQIAALQWVHDNIATFGGDPDNVTIFGESAGGKSVLALFASPLARGLFHKGIAQSSYIIPDMTRSKALEMGVAVADAVGLAGASASISELRGIPAEKFGALKGAGLSNSPVPISGDEVLPVSIADTFKAGREAPLPLIVGNTSDDGSIATDFGLDPAELVKNVTGAGLALRLLYPGVTDEAERARQATRDLVFTMPVRWIADRHSRRAKTWRYYFDYTAAKLRPSRPHGVPHGGEIHFVFGTGDIWPVSKDSFTDEDRAFSDLISDYWVEFARDGVPSSQGGPAWPPDQILRDRTMIFDARNVEVRSNFMRARLTAMIGVTKLVEAFTTRK